MSKHCIVTLSAQSSCSGIATVKQLTYRWNIHMCAL